MISYKDILPLSELKNIITNGDVNKLELRRDKNDTLEDESVVGCIVYVRESKHNHYISNILAHITKAIRGFDISQKEKDILGGIYSEIHQNNWIKESTLDKLLKLENMRDVHFGIPNEYKTKFWRT